MSHLLNANSSQLAHIQQQLQQQQQQQQQYLQQQQQQENEANKLKRYFYNRTQTQNETAEQFLAELERLGRRARMDLEAPHNSLESIVRERFVQGLRDPQAKVNILHYEPILDLRLVSLNFSGIITVYASTIDMFWVQR
jgi:hypothetical protein